MEEQSLTVLMVRASAACKSDKAELILNLTSADQVSHRISQIFNIKSLKFSQHFEQESTFSNDLDACDLSPRMSCHKTSSFHES